MKSFHKELQNLDLLDENQPEKIFLTKFQGRTYDYFKPHLYKLDQKFLKIAHEIEHNFRMILFSKPDQVRVEQWLKKLFEYCCERIPLMKNRNKYLKLLKLCVFDLKRLEGVFKKMPPTEGEELRMIQNHEILEIEHQAHNNNKKRKRSMKHAQEMYNYNNQRAKEQMADLPFHKPSKKPTEQSKNSRTRNPTALADQYYSVAKNLTPKSQVGYGRVTTNKHNFINSGRKQSQTVNNTIFDTTVSPIYKTNDVNLTSHIPEFKKSQKHQQQKNIKQAFKHNFKPQENNETPLQNQRSQSLICLQVPKIPLQAITQQPKAQEDYSYHTQSVQEYHTAQKSTRRSRAERNAAKSSQSVTSQNSIDDGYHVKLGDFKQYSTVQHIDHSHTHRDYSDSNIFSERSQNIRKNQKHQGTTTPKYGEIYKRANSKETNKKINLSPTFSAQQFKSYAQKPLPSINISNLDDKKEKENLKKSDRSNYNNLQNEIDQTLKELNNLRAETASILKKKDFILNKQRFR